MDAWNGIADLYPQNTGTKAHHLRIWSRVSGSKGRAERLVQLWLMHFCHPLTGQEGGPWGLIHSLLGLCGRCSYRAHHWRLTQAMMTQSFPQVLHREPSTKSQVNWCDMHLTSLKFSEMSNRTFNRIF